MELFIAINIPVEINIREEHMAVKIRKETVKDINGSDGSDPIAMPQQQQNEYWENYSKKRGQSYA